MTKAPSHTPRWLCILFSSIFLGILLFPMLGGLVAGKGTATKTQLKAGPPPLNAANLLTPEYYQAWTHFADAWLTADSTLTRIKSWIDYNLFDMTDAQGIFVGRDGWLFNRGAIDAFRKNGCRQRMHIQRLARNLDAVARLAEFSGRRFVFSVVPDKITLYPEYVGAVPQARDCGQSTYDILLVEHRQRPIAGFVRLDELLRTAKDGRQTPYGQTTAYWNAEGAAVAARALSAHIFGGTPFAETPDDDLAAEIMAPHASMEKSAGHGAAAMADDKHLSAALIYGGPALAHLLPYITPHFERVDIIASNALPSANHHEDPSAYETIVVIATETQLADLSVDVDKFCRLLDVDAIATAKTDIPLAGISAQKDIAFDPGKNMLRIKSMGATAHFKLPGTPGSDDNTLRVLAMDLKAPHLDELTWGGVQESGPYGTRTLGSDIRRLYLPLPREPAVQLTINAGRAPGIFELYAMSLLSFSKVTQFKSAVYKIEPAAPADTEVREAPVTAGHESPSAIKTAGPKQPQPPPEAPAMVVAPSITLNDFEARRVFQRRGNACDITISGTYQGDADTIEARVKSYDGDNVIVPWTVVDTSPGNGIYMGVIPGVPQGGWYRLAVRLGKHPEVTTEGRHPWAVGLLAAFIGQSNMREWFYTGSDLSADHRVSVHRHGRWVEPDGLGNGAAAFANRLVEALDIPVGLLDYAVNGSGLRREADWGTGYWADRGPGSIYSRFVQGVTATGGVLEYVVWMQGEADAGRKTITENQYRGTLGKFITRQVRNDIVNGSPMPHLPFLVVGMPKRTVGLDAPHQAVRNALTAVTREVEDCYLSAVSLDLKNQGRQHLAPEAYTQLGQRTAQTILYLLDKSAYYRGPTAVLAKKLDDRLIDIHLIHRGGNDIEPLTGITGFLVMDNKETPVSTDLVQRVTPSTIRIRLNQPAPGALRVAYLYGAMPDSGGAVHDNSPLKLPLEPFEMNVK